jgi:hypothetical protein
MLINKQYKQFWITNVNGEILNISCKTGKAMNGNADAAAIETPPCRSSLTGNSLLDSVAITIPVIIILNIYPSEKNKPIERVGCLLKQVPAITIIRALKIFSFLVSEFFNLLNAHLGTKGASSIKKKSSDFIAVIKSDQDM